MVFVDSDADNLRPGDLLDLPRPEGSFGRKGVGAEAESRDRETLAVLVLAQQRSTSLDLAKAQVQRARVLSQDLAHHAGVSLRFEAGDIRGRMSEADRSVDICVCLYCVLNHLPADDLPAVFGEVARITKGRFVATIRAIGSMPTIYVDGVKAARVYHQDNVLGRLEVEFDDGGQTSFPSRLFSAAEIRALAAPALQIDELSGLDLFHGRFATDPDWNPPEATPDANFVGALRALERRFHRNPAFVDHATHLLLLARPKRS